MNKTFLLATVAATILSCEQAEKPKVAGVQGLDMEAAGKSIAAVNDRFGKALGSGDSAAVVSLYHSGAMLLPPNLPEWNSAEGMGAFAIAGQKMGITKAELKTSELLNGGDYVIEKGNYELTAGNSLFDKGKYIVIWKQEGDDWKLFRDIWNSDNPPPASK